MGDTERHTHGMNEGMKRVANVKTAISLRESLFEQVDRLAREMKVPRSRVFALALEEYLSRHQAQQMLRQINEAYADYPDASEQAVQRGMRRLQRDVVGGEW
jgi:metal-responsive CopG/Arc/MetJ family transcriptional regulator